MAIMLGNLSLTQIQDRCGMTFQDEVVEYLKKTYEPNADVQAGTEKWHGFDLPFCIFCGNIEMARYLNTELSKLDWTKCKESLQIQYHQVHRTEEQI